MEIRDRRHGIGLGANQTHTTRKNDPTKDEVERERCADPSRAQPNPMPTRTHPCHSRSPAVPCLVAGGGLEQRRLQLETKACGKAHSTQHAQRVCTQRAGRAASAWEAQRTRTARAPPDRELMFALLGASKLHARPARAAPVQPASRPAHQPTTQLPACVRPPPSTRAHHHRPAGNKLLLRTIHEGLSWRQRGALPGG